MYCDENLRHRQTQVKTKLLYNHLQKVFSNIIIRSFGIIFIGTNSCCLYELGEVQAY